MKNTIRICTICLLAVSVVILALPVLVVLAQEAPAEEALPEGPDPTGEITLKRALRDGVNAPANYVWVLVTAFLVFFMQAGFAMVETGFCRAKNATNLMAKNLLDFCMSSIFYMAFGFSLMMGADVAGLFGTGGWFLKGSNWDVGRYLLFLFQLVFAGTAATIVSGAVAERLKFSAYLIYSATVSALIYPIYGHWVWGGGWLTRVGGWLGLANAPYGHLDFAGSGVVHTIGGGVALAGAIMLGPRFGKYDKEGNPRAIPGHSITLAALGTFILWFGWFGFNPGSTLSAEALRISVIAVTTNLAAAAGAIAAIILSYIRTGKWDVGMALNGVLAGLVAITAPCAWVEAWAAIVIGAIAGVLVVYSVLFLERVGVDDPVGAVSVHFTNGIWGLISLGLFADGTYGNYSTATPHVIGLFYGGGIDQLIAQIIGVIACAVWAVGLGLVLFKVMDLSFGIRVSPEEELMGLDIHEHGSLAYPDFKIDRVSFGYIPAARGNDTKKKKIPAGEPVGGRK